MVVVLNFFTFANVSILFHLSNNCMKIHGSNQYSVISMSIPCRWKIKTPYNSFNSVVKKEINNPC